MADSKSEKCGITVFGCRLSDNVEHVPIKKRKFLFRSPSPPSTNPLSCPGESKRLREGECGFRQICHLDQENKCQDSTFVTDSGQIVNEKLNEDVNKLEKVNEQSNDGVDLSNMATFAVAACSNTSKENYERADSGVVESFVIDNKPLSLLSELSAKEDEHSAEVSTEGTGSCSTGHATELAASFRANKSSPRKLTCGKDMISTYLCGTSEDVSDVSTGDGTVRTHKGSSQDDRLYWDLNLEMDAWEYPRDCQDVDPRTNVGDVTSKDFEDEMHNYKNVEVDADVQRKLGATTCNNEKIKPPSINVGLSSDSRESSLRGHLVKEITSSQHHGESDSNAISEVSISDERHPRSLELLNRVSGPPAQRVKPGLPVGGGSLPSRQISSSDSCSDLSVLSKCHHSTSTSKSDEICKSYGNVEGPSALHVNRSDFKAVIVRMETSQSRTEPLDHTTEDSICRLADAPSPCSVGAFVRNQFAASMDTCELKVSVHHHAQANPEGHIEAGRTMSMSSGNSAALLGKPYMLNSRDGADVSYSNDIVNRSDKLAHGESSEDNCNSDFSRNNCGFGSGISEVQADYDSQYEDGELRESDDRTWEEYAGECEEAEHMDNTTVHNRSGCNVSMSVQVKEEEDEVFMNDLRGRDLIMARTTSTGSAKEGVNRSSQLYLTARVSNIDIASGSDISVKMDEKTGVVPDESTLASYVPRGDDAKNVDQSALTNNSTSDVVNAVGSKDTETKVVEFRARRREFQSYMGGRLNCDSFAGKDRLHRSNSFDVSSPRLQSDSNHVEFFGRGRYSQCNYEGDRQGNHFFHSAGNRGLKHQHSCRYEDLEELPRKGPGNSSTAESWNLESDRLITSESTITKPVGLDGQKTTDPFSHGRDTLFRSRSPAVRNETFGMHVRRLAGEVSPDGCLTANQGSNMRCGPRFQDKNHRRRYHAPTSDDCVHSNYSNHLRERNRSFSPIETNKNSSSHRSKSPSRFRTRYLSNSHYPRGTNRRDFARNSYFRNRSRSPDFTTRGRILRMRSPPQRLGFLEDNVEGSRSMSRRCGSPLQDSRWNDSRKDGRAHFREHCFSQRSSVFNRETFPRRERFDFDDSQQKDRSNDHLRSAHPGRFSRMNGIPRRGSRHDGNDDDRIHGYRQGLVRPQRHYNVDGASKPFYYDIEDGFATGHISRNKDATDFHGRGSTKDYNKSIDSEISDMPRESRGLRSTILSLQDGNIDDNSKLFGKQKCKEDISPKEEETL